MYDNALLGILQHVGNIQDFLQVFFGFLYRKTDFYRRLSGPNDRMGFPPGVAEKMVLKVKFTNVGKLPLPHVKIHYVHCFINTTNKYYCKKECKSIHCNVVIRLWRSRLS